jgi:DnaJ-class molecular chaperone
VGSNEASTKKFQEIKEAYDTLKDEQVRSRFRGKYLKMNFRGLENSLAET